MKILITTDLFTTATNGVVTSVRNLRDELKNRGHDVRILTLSENLDSYKDGDVYYIKSISIEFVYPDVRMPLSYHNDLVDELIEWKPDVIHSQCEFFSFQYAQRIAKITGAPLLHTYHTLYEQYVAYVVPSKRLGRRMVQELSRIRLKHVNMIIAPTTKVEDALREYGMDNDIQVIPSGISLEQHNGRLNDAEKLEKRRTLGISEDSQILLNLGRLGTEKNLSELLQFFKVAMEQNPRLFFLVVGDGPDRKHLEELAEELDISKRMLFTGMVQPTQVQEYYQIADVFVSASTSETQGLTYIEAIANGLPLLCRSDKCLQGVIQEGINGYEYTSQEDFLDKLNSILSDPQWQMNAKAQSERIAENFGKGHFVDAMEEMYKALLEEEL